MEHEDYIEHEGHITEIELTKFIMANPIIQELDEQITTVSKKEREEEVSQNAIEKHIKSIEHLNIMTITELQEKLEKNKNNIPVRIMHCYPGVTHPFSPGLSLFYLYQVLVAQSNCPEHTKSYLEIMEFGVCKQDIDELYDFLKRLARSFE